MIPSCTEANRLAPWARLCASLVLAATVLLGLGFSAPAATDPRARAKLWDTCRQDDGAAGLAACMAIINTRGIAKQEHAAAYYNRCYNYLMRHDYRNALANCDRSLEIEPSRFDPWLARGVAAGVFPRRGRLAPTVGGHVGHARALEQRPAFRRRGGKRAPGSGRRALAGLNGGCTASPG